MKKMTPFIPEKFQNCYIVAPASAPTMENLDAAVAYLQKYHLNVKWNSQGYSGDQNLKYLANSDIQRKSELENAWKSADSASLIMSARGGYGTMRLLDSIDWSLVPNVPLVGYSDLTALLFAMTKFKVGYPIIGVNACGLEKRMEDEWTRKSLYFSLSRTGNLRIPLSGCSLFPGKVDGPLYAGNLSLLNALIGTPYLPSFKGAILLIEDIDEPVRKIDCFLTHLHLAGILDSLGGLLFGSFKGNENPEALQYLFQQWANKLKIPVISGISFGHDLPTLCFPLGEYAQIESGVENSLTLSFLSEMKK